MADYPVEHVGIVIRKMREEKGYTAHEICDGLYNEASFSKIENGKARPHPDKINKIAEKLGEKNFYERYLMGVNYSRFLKKRQAKKAAKQELEAGQLENVEERLIQLKNLIEDADGGDDMRFYLTLQTIWYEKNGVDLKNRSKRFIEIFEMNKKFPTADMSVREVVDGGNFSETDYLLVNNVGLALLEEGRTELGAKTLIGLYTDILEKMEEGPKKRHKLSVAANNCAKALFEMGEFQEAYNLAERALEHSIKSMDVKLMISALKTESDILYAKGEENVALELISYVKVLENTLGQVSQKVGIKLPFELVESGIAVL